MVLSYLNDSTNDFMKWVVNEHSLFPSFASHLVLWFGRTTKMHLFQICQIAVNPQQLQRAGSVCTTDFSFRFEQNYSMR